ncbi:MAG: uroporphyrinogen-III synthase [Gemmatimonadaceae bacterium]
MAESREASAPLRGRRVILTRPRDQAAPLARRLRALGAECLVLPAIAIEPPDSWAALDAALERLEQYDWLVLTSANAARAVRDRLAELRIPADRLANLRLAAVGPRTAAAFEGVPVASTIVAHEHVAEALAAEIPDVNGRKVLFPRGDLARDVLPTTLRARGAAVDEPIVYRTVAGDGVSQIVREIAADSCDAIVFASPSAVRIAAAALSAARLSISARARRGRPAVFCLGPVTSAAAGEFGIEAQGVGRADVESLADALVLWFAGSAHVN